MTQTVKNPYPIQPDFELRLHRAATAIKKLGDDPWANIYTREFDHCFEMGDGDAIVFALMHRAYVEPDCYGQSRLTEGIRTMFRRKLNIDGFPPRWEETANPWEQLSLFD